MLNYLIKRAFSDKVRKRTWSKLATFLRYNVGELRAMRMLHDRYAARRHILARLFETVIRDLNQGYSLDAALLPWVPQEEIMLIRGGLKSARLPEALQDCVALIEAREKITGGIAAAVRYPVFLLLLFVLLLFVVSLYVVPELSRISDPDAWTGMAAVLHAVSSFIASVPGLLTLLGIFILFAVILASLSVWTGPVRARMDRFPPWSIYRLTTGSVWMFTVATLLKANIALDQILRDMLDSGVLRPWLRERVTLIRDRYQREANLGEVLLQLDLNFPDQELVEELAVYSSFPDFHKNLYSIAKDWLAEGVERVEMQAKMVNTGLLLCIVAILCGMGLSIGSIQQQLMGGM